jgi:acyl-CoA synthetase (AMP-forming)/AMP-acid ligase II/acyl carrier protein
MRGWAAQPARRAFTFLADGRNEAGQWTYAELDLRARALAGKLQQELKPGEPILLLQSPGLDYILSFLGCLYAGVLPVPAYPARNDRLALRLNGIIGDCRAAAALTTASELAAMQPALKELPDLARLRWLTTDHVAAEWADDWNEPTPAPDAPAFLQYTSGSTTSPRGVVVTHGNLLHNSAAIYRCLGHSPATCGVHWLPPYHDLGLIGAIVQTVYSGVWCIFMPPIAFLQDPYLWLWAVSHYRAQSTGGPNFAYDLCVRKITPEQKATLDLSCLQVAANGAEPVNPATLRRFAEAFAECGFRPDAFYPTYGLAEATLLVTGGDCRAAPVNLDVDADALKRNRVAQARAPSQAKTLVGCGRSLPDQQVLIVDPESKTCLASDHVGEVWVSGPSVARGYFGKAEESDQIFRASLADGSGSFLRTGDLGFLHNGELFVTGRRKDLCIIRGRNIYPQDVEATVGGCHDALLPDGGAVFTVEQQGTEQLVVLQELKPAHLTGLDAEPVFRAIVQAVIDHHEVKPTAVVLLRPGGILRTSSGKVQRHACKNAYVNKQLPVVAEKEFPPATCLSLGASASREQLLDFIAQSLSIPAGELNLDQRLDTMPIDSLKAFELKVSLEEAYQVKLPLTAFAQSQTMRDFLALLGVPLGDNPLPSSEKRNVA